MVIAVLCIMSDIQNVIYMFIPTYEWRNCNDIITPTSSQHSFDVTVALLLHYVSAGDGALNHDIKMFNFTWKYLIIVYIYYYHTYIMQISIYIINDMPEPGRNLAADACMERTQLSPCIISVLGHSVPTGMPCQHDIIFYAEPLISRFSSEIYITLLQHLWQTVLVWNLYPIFILSNQLAVKITRPSLSFGCICINSSTCCSQSMASFVYQYAWPRTIIFIVVTAGWNI